jgi:hypothetical protein
MSRASFTTIKIAAIFNRITRQHRAIFSRYGAYRKIVKKVRRSIQFYSILILTKNRATETRRFIKRARRM